MHKNPPKNTAASPTNILNMIYIKAFIYCAFCIICQLSALKVLNVVKPPQNPAVNNSLMFGETCSFSVKKIYKKPRIKHPMILTKNVAIGRFVFM